MNLLQPLLLCAFSTVVLAQEPPLPSATPAPVAPVSSVGSTGFGRAASYRQALAFALEDAVAKVKGVQVARGVAVHDRLLILGQHPAGERVGWFDGTGDAERDWVLQQISGFVAGYEVQKREKVDGEWDVTVRATVATAPDSLAPVVVELADSGLTKWRLARFEAAATSVPFDRQGGDYRGPELAKNLRSCPGVVIAGGGARVRVGGGAAPAEREKDGRQVVASHRVEITFGTLELQSVVEKPNIAWPTNGPRPEYVTSGGVDVTVRVEDLVRGVSLLDEHFTVPADLPAGFAADRAEAAVQSLADKARTIVAQKVFFALRPPVVLRKWAGDKPGEWLVEAQMPRAVAAGFQHFVVGVDGSLAEPDWHPVVDATLVGGTATSCTFRIDGLEDASVIEADVAQVRPQMP